MTADVATLEYLRPPEIIVPMGTVASPLPKWTYVIPSNGDATTSAKGGFDAHFSKLKALATDHSLWADAEAPPSDFASQWARLVIQQLETESFQPARIVASAEGGIAVCFVDGNKYGDIECLNSGAILGVISNKRDRPIVWEVEQDARGVARATTRIRNFIIGYETSANDSGRADRR